MADKMTREDFEVALGQWSQEARSEMVSILQAKTHSSGALARSLKVKVSENSKISRHSIGFTFKKYGVHLFRGVGRGWVMSGGTVQRGSHVKKDSVRYNQLLKKGYKKKDIRNYIISSTTQGKGRKPLDWFDSVLYRRAEKLGDIAAGYYGDVSMDNIMDAVSRGTIAKKAVASKYSPIAISTTFE